MRSDDVRAAVLRHLRGGGHLSLFLDYDGTLVPIAPTPAEAVPDGPLLALLQDLAARRSIRTFILSGRPLRDLQALLPVRGLILAGLYGVEMGLEGQTVFRSAPANGSLAPLRKEWASLAGDLPGFLLEDKGQALALHARWASGDDAARVLPAARQAANRLLDAEAFRVLDGDRYVEAAPRAADKGSAVDWLLGRFPVERDLAVGFGDDNKDDSAFAALHRHNGYAIGVDERYPLPEADVRLPSHTDVRDWLRSFVHAAP